MYLSESHAFNTNYYANTARLAYCELYVTLATAFRRFPYPTLKVYKTTPEDMEYVDYFVSALLPILVCWGSPGEERPGSGVVNWSIADRRVEFLSYERQELVESRRCLRRHQWLPSRNCQIFTSFDAGCSAPQPSSLSLSFKCRCASSKLVSPFRVGLHSHLSSQLLLLLGFINFPTDGTTMRSSMSTQLTPSLCLVVTQVIHDRDGYNDDFRQHLAPLRSPLPSWKTQKV